MPGEPYCSRMARRLRRHGWRFAVGLVATTLVMVLALPSSSARSFVIKAKGGGQGFGKVLRIGPFRVARDPALRAAVDAFGKPSSRRALGGRRPALACRAAWRRLGVTVVFANLAGEDACKPRFGVAQSAFVYSRRWQTGRGLRVGDRVRRISRLYPKAIRTGRFYKLVTGVKSFAGPRRYAVLGARLAGRRVRALTMDIGAAGE